VLKENTERPFSFLLTSNEKDRTFVLATDGVTDYVKYAESPRAVSNIE